MAMPTKVFTSDTASAPASAAAAAMGTMFVTFGVSLAISGRGQTARTPATTRRVTSGSVAKSTPPETFGQERFNSSAARPGFFADLLRHRHEFMLRLAGDVGDDGGRQRAQIRQMVSDEMIDAVVVETDGVEHARRRFDRARRRVADAWLCRHRLGNDAAQLGEIDDARHFARVAEGAGGDEDGIR